MVAREYHCVAMTTTGACIVVITLLGCVLAVTTASHAESAWMLWQQATVFTERWWIPNGWPAHWRTTEMTPVALSEFQTLADCQLAQDGGHESRRRSSKRSGGEGDIRHVRRQVRRQIRLRAIRLATTEDRAWRGDARTEGEGSRHKSRSSGHVRARGLIA